MGTFTYRLMGAAVLDRSIYEGIEADPRANRQALAVVLLSSIAAGIGAAGLGGPRLTTLLTVAGIALVTWLAWAALILQIGAHFLPGRDTEVTFGQLLRTVGFAASPGLLQVFAVFFPRAAIVFAALWVWMLVAMVIAIRQALDYHSTARAAAVSVAALSIVLAVAVTLGLVFGPTLAF